MNKIKSLLIDDEKHSRKLLQKYINDYCDEIDLVDNAKDVDDAYRKIVNHKPQLVFLDIALHEETAFDLLNKFETIDFEIIFITAYDNHAIKAIKLSAVDYLLKPINIEHLVNAVQKACKRIEKKESTNHLEVFFHNLNQKENLNKIALPTLTGYIFIPVADVVRCKAEGSYTQFHITNRKPVLVSKGLKEYEGLLSRSNFIRVHHSHLINLNHVTEYFKGKAAYIKMSDQSSVEVSTRKREYFLSRLESLKA
ncbi:MAG: DNA-binding response regulator [Bacteroidetes bacterium]|nr:MAG: DNA-binding response regulator [Bacteroidota bacterium]